MEQRKLGNSDLGVGHRSRLHGHVGFYGETDEQESLATLERP
jgi:hypothetical protein